MIKKEKTHRYDESFQVLVKQSELQNKRRILIIQALAPWWVQ